MLDRIVKEKWFTARATIGFWPANAVGDDIAVYADDSRKTEIATFHTLRQQLEKREGRFNSALSDFIAPVSSGVPDYIGAFVVTAGIGEDVVADRFKNANDDYSSILCKALADRLAEAFAERMHQRVRKEFWGYAPDEALPPDQLILEQYAGIRPAPGYPAQPDHTEKATLFALLDAEKNAGVKLTESYAMWPGSSVSGLYFSHPESFYFGVGKIERDQVEDYAARKGMSVAETERWLAPVLNYIPAQDQSGRTAAPRAMPTPAPARPCPPTTSPRIRPAAPARCIWPSARRRWGRKSLPPLEVRSPSTIVITGLDPVIHLQRDSCEGGCDARIKSGDDRVAEVPHEILLLLAIAGELSGSHRAQSEEPAGGRRVRRSRCRRASHRRLSPRQSADGAAGAGAG